MWRATAVWWAWLKSVPSSGRIIKRGMRYSNIEPPHDSRPIRSAASMNGRPSWNQWRLGASPRAIARKLDRQASDAMRS